MRFELVRRRLTAIPGELPSAPGILTPVRVDEPEELFPAAGSPDAPAPRRAAVLVLLFPDESGEARVLLIARAQSGAHGGEIGFPGGAVEDGDADATATALREACEEVGLDPEACGLRVAGMLDPVAVFVSGFRITPVVATTERRPDCLPDPAEVDRILDAPVDAFLPGAPIELEERALGERTIRYGFYPVEGVRIWGATARMLGQLGALLVAEADDRRPD